MYRVDDFLKPVERPVLFQGAMVGALLAGTKTQTRRIIKDQSIGERFSHMTDDGRAHLEWLGTPCCGTGVWDVPEYNAQVSCPYGQPGDRLWVRETFYAFGRWETRFSAEKGRDEWHFIDMTLECWHAYHYDVEDPVKIIGAKGRGGATPMWWKRPAIFMPRAACRILLEVTEVRVQRLQDISEADAIAEGIEPNPAWIGTYRDYSVERERQVWNLDPVASYRTLWDSINGKTPGAAWADNPWVWAVSFMRVTS